MNNYPFFEVEYRGVKIQVEPENFNGRWECRFSHDDTGDWKDLKIGNFPSVGTEPARKAALALAKDEHETHLHWLYQERSRINDRIAELEKP